MDINDINNYINNITDDEKNILDEIFYKINNDKKTLSELNENNSTYNNFFSVKKNKALLLSNNFYSVLLHLKLKHTSPEEILKCMGGC